MITASNLHRSYSIGKKSIEILHGVDLHIAAGEKVFLCGPSGAGKTTLMYTLAGLETPQEGKVTIDGTDIYALSATARAVFRNRNMAAVNKFRTQRHSTHGDKGTDDTGDEDRQQHRHA